MKRTPVNLLPPGWRQARISVPLPSLALCCVLSALIIGTSLSSLPQPALASASPQTAPDENAGTFRVELFDDAAYSLARGSIAYPWHTVFHKISGALGEESSIDAFTFQKTALTISGNVPHPSDIPLIMAALDELDWLHEPDPHQLQRDPKTGFYTFQIRARVTPLLTWKGVLE